MIKYSNHRRKMAFVAGLGVSMLALTVPSVSSAQSGNFSAVPQTKVKKANDDAEAFARLMRTANSQLRSRALQKATDPVVRIVSPLNGSTIAPGISKVNKGSPNGTGFLVNIELVTRDSIPIVLREATMAPPVFGIRHVPELEKGKNNVDVPGLGLFFDVPLVTPDGKIFPAFHNFANAFNVSGSDDTPGPGMTAWLGWHVLESMLPTDKDVTLTVTFSDALGRVTYDQVRVKAGKAGVSGQSLTPAPETFKFKALTTSDGQGPEVSLIAPRVPTSIAVGPTDSSLNANNGALFFIHLSAVDRRKAGIAVSETGLTTAGTPLNTAIPFGLIFDPSTIPAPANGNVSSANRNFPGMSLTFDVPLRQPNGNIVPAGTNLGGLFDVAGSEIDAQGFVRTTADWVVGGSLVMPAGKTTVTMKASVTDNAGHTGTTQQVVTVSEATSGQELTADPVPK